MSAKTRIKQLEKTHAPKKKKYMCVIGLEFWDTPEEKAKGYKVQPFTVESGGTGGEPFYIATREELDKFAARDDVDLDIIQYSIDEPKAA